MAKISRIFDIASIEEEASRWLVRLDAEDVAPETRAAFEHWLRGHPWRRKAYLRLARTWDRLDELEALRPSPSRYGPDADLTRRYVKPAGRRWTGRAVAFASAAACFVAIAVGWAVFLVQNGAQVYETEVGERLTVALPDSSVVELNTDSALQVAFTETERRVRLLRGEGHFEIAHAPERPFIVAAETGTVRALGTAFNVRLLGHTVEVTVTEGLVEVAPAERDPDPPSMDADSDRSPPDLAVPVSVGLGQQVRVSPMGAAIVDVDPETIERKLAWRRGMLIFNGESLEKVIEEIGRYTRKRIVFADDDLRRLEVGGYFRADDVDDVLSMIATAFSIEIRPAGRDTIYLVKSASSSQG